MERDLAQSRALLAAGFKDRARLHLAKRKHQATLLDRVTAQLLTLEHLTSTLEHAVVEAHLLASLETGNAVLRELQRDMDLERVFSVMDEVGDGIAAQREVEEALGSLLSAEESEAIALELDQLVAAEQEAREGAVPVQPVSWPVVPKGDVLPVGDARSIAAPPAAPTASPPAERTSGKVALPS